MGNMKRYLIPGALLLIVFAFALFVGGGIIGSNRNDPVSADADNDYQTPDGCVRVLKRTRDKRQIEEAMEWLSKHPEESAPLLVKELGQMDFEALAAILVKIGAPAVPPLI